MENSLRNELALKHYAKPYENLHFRTQNVVDKLVLNLIIERQADQIKILMAKIAAAKSAMQELTNNLNSIATDLYP